MLEDWNDGIGGGDSFALDESHGYAVNDGLRGLICGLLDWKEDGTRNGGGVVEELTGMRERQPGRVRNQTFTRQLLPENEYQ